MIPDVLELAHLLVARAGLEGGIALDGTVGNGYDTAFLAAQVGAGGHVYGFDVQAAALDATRHRLEFEGVVPRVTLLHADHACLNELLPHAVSLRAAMFNLGYLPHSDKSIITRAGSTVAALQAAFDRLERAAPLTVMLYRGHSGGEEEANAVVDWARALPTREAAVYYYQPLNARRPPPIAAGDWQAIATYGPQKCTPSY